MKQLETSFVKNDMQYDLVKRSETVALYSLSSRSGKKPIVAYEVFDIPKQKAKTTIINGVEVSFEEKERVPSNEEFGLKFRSQALVGIETATKYFNYLNNTPPVAINKDKITKSVG